MSDDLAALLRQLVELIASAMPAHELRASPRTSPRRRRGAPTTCPPALCVRCARRERHAGRRLCRPCLTGEGLTLDELIAAQAEDMRYGDRLGVIDRERFGITHRHRQWTTSLDALPDLPEHAGAWDDPTFDEVCRRVSA